MDHTSKLAEFVTGLSYNDLPSGIVGRVKLLVTDVMANLIGARNYPYSRILARFVTGQSGKTEATLPGSKRKYPVANVVLTNCAMAHSLELDDTHNESCAHIGAAIVPSAFAVAERENAGAQEFISAVALGVEVMARVGKAFSPQTLYGKGFHPSSVCAPFGVAAAAGRLLHLVPKEMARAFGLAATQSSGLLCAKDEGAWTWYLQYGRAAQSGVYSAYFAKEGITAPSDIFGRSGGLASIYGPDTNLALLTEGLGNGFALSGLSFKFHSCLHFGQASTDALLKILEEHPLSCEEIAEIRLHLPSAAFGIIDQTEYPMARLAAQANPRYIMAVGALARRVTPAEFSREYLSDGRVRELFDRVRLVADKELDNLFPSRWPAMVEVVTTDGKTRSCMVKNAHGDADNPPVPADVQRKFRTLTDGLITAGQTETLLQKVSTLESLADVTPLASILANVRTD